MQQSALNTSPNNSFTHKRYFQITPTLQSIIITLNRYHIRYGIFAGAHVAFLTNHRAPTDFDILAHDNDVDMIIKKFPHIRRKSKDSQFEGNLFFPAADESVELITHSTVHINGHAYPFRLTPSAWEHTSIKKVKGIDMRFLNPVDTILFKAILQRGIEENKTDRTDILAILASCSLDYSYLVKRIAEIHADERVLRYLSGLGIKTQFSA